MAVWDRLTTLVAGGALSRSAGTALDAAFETTRQQARGERAVRVLEPGTAAALRARETLKGVPGIGLQGVDLADDAQRGAVGKNRFDLLTELARTMPGVGELVRLRRRNVATKGDAGITDPELTEALRRSGFTEDHVKALRGLVFEKLSPGELAAAIHRGLVPDPGLLKGEQPKAPFNVEAYPVYPIDADAEAFDHGYDKDRLGVLVGLQGLPMGVIEAAHAFYRKIITYGDYIRAFNESNNRNEWAAAVLEYARQIPTARDFFENALRGYHSFEWAVKQAERHGMTEADATVIYQNQGRPMNIRQITQALSRGAKFNPEPGELTDPYEAATVEGSVKPAYYELFKALKYTLPSPFVMRSLTASGVWSEAKAAKRLKDIGWIPQDADEAAHAWATGTTSGVDPHVAKAETHLWNTTHNSFKAGESDEDQTRANLDVLGVPAAEQDRIIFVWGVEAATVRKQLTPSQIKKAYEKLAINDATGQRWTREEALDALVDLGYSIEAAENLLNIPSGQ